MADAYYQQQDEKNILKIRAILEELPSFCRTFFHDITDYTSTRTRLAYAYDLRVFFEFIHENNPVYAKMAIHEYPIEILDRITKDDINEYLDYMALYEKDGKKMVNHEKGKARKIASLRSFYNFYFKNEKIRTNPAALISLPKQHDKEIQPITTQLDKLLAAQEKERGMRFSLESDSRPPPARSGKRADSCPCAP